MRTIFFDLGGTLGEALLSTAQRLVSFVPFDFSAAILEKLKSAGHRLGIISNTGDDAGAVVDQLLERAGLLQYFDDLRIYSFDAGVRKPAPEIFFLALQRCGPGYDPAHALYVGEDATERAAAASAGMRVAPHPALVVEVLQGALMQYVRIGVPAEALTEDWRGVLRTLPLVPLHVTGRGGDTVYAIVSSRALASLVDMRFSVELLGAPDEPNGTDLFILRDDRARRTGALVAEGESARLLADDRKARLVLSARNDGLVVAIPPDMELEELHFQEARHGHALRLIASPALLAKSPRALSIASAPLAVPALPSALIEHLSRIDAKTLLERVERYSGQRALDGSASPARIIVSRYIRHPDNVLAVEAMADELRKVGNGELVIRLHPFVHKGRELHNVEAELAGMEPEVTLVTAHLDSTAASSTPFDGEVDPAPGADDDGSGVAAVLSIAAHFAALPAELRPKNTVRFVLFNAEEEGLVGSAAYARLQRALATPISGVFQMDMIGYNVAPPRSWEVHVGHAADADVERRSMPLARLVRDAAAAVSPALERLQIYRSPDDPGDTRSDHTSFQALGYPACVISEDLFAGNVDDGPHEPNPNYHKRDDTFIDAGYAADIARAVAAAAWLNARSLTSTFASVNTAKTITQEETVSNPRNFDSRKALAAQSAMAAGTRPPWDLAAMSSSARGTAALGNTDRPAGPGESDDLRVRAVAFVKQQDTGFAARDADPSEYVPDAAVNRTSTGSASVNLHQTFRGVPIFQMTKTVVFSPRGKALNVTGDSAVLMPEFDVVPRIDAQAAAVKAAAYLSMSLAKLPEESDSFGEPLEPYVLDATQYAPEIISGFPLAAQPTVLTKGPFEHDIPLFLVIFVQPDRPRLGWHIILTLPAYRDQFVLIVAADESAGEILFSTSTLHHARARGLVYEYSPADAERRMVEFPRPLTDYPSMPGVPLAGFPHDWVEHDLTAGNCTVATLNESGDSLAGVPQNGVVEFNPGDGAGDDQKLLNIFYFCNYMHDFLYVLGFDEAAGNFQKVNFTREAAGNDFVRARAHSGAVQGTANMLTAPDGRPPLMNMGAYRSRHTAFDADVVFHEYVHGLTNRLVGGRLDPYALLEPQSKGMGEGWSDYFALTIQSYTRGAEKVVTADWLTGNPRGMRTAAYDDSYPRTYGDIARMSGEHPVGEVWCAVLMMMTRRMRQAFGDDGAGYRLSWQIVVDGLKVTPANPTFLQGRDAILRSLDDLLSVSRITPAVHAQARRAAWQAFAHFGMGFEASCADAGLAGIREDRTLPPDLTAAN